MQLKSKKKKKKKKKGLIFNEKDTKQITWKKKKGTVKY